MADPANTSRPPRDSERNSLGGRFKRYAQVGTSMSGVAARMAGERYLGLKGDKSRQAGELKAALGGLKGPLMKVAQILSTIPDAVPEEYAAELGQLQANAPHMGWPFVKRRMSAELGPDWERRFESFEREAAAAASLGQVHRAVAVDGRRLALKLQYPDMASVVEADLKQLKLIFSLQRRYDPSIDSSDLHGEIADRLREELDYDREARNMRLYRYMLREEGGVHLPEPVPELSTRRLLAMTWLDGTPLLDQKGAPQEQRNALAHSMFRAWYVPFYNYGVIHGDPHLGNYQVRADGTSINLLDFGAIRVFRPTFVHGVLELYHALNDDDRDRAVHAYESWGFTNLTHEVVDVLNLWAGFLYAPLLEDRPRLINETHGGTYGREVARQVHQRLREVGGVRIPREFVLMDRAALGLGSVFLHLSANINWHQMFWELVKDFDVEVLAQRQAEALAQAGLTTDADHHTVRRD
ncbi:ABC1 kinase family protein [Roseospirillum parvum]|uniref:Predicted unusual protein kinase regulating ubiquinone biosynthesis, AarF/ABC1/UbiB family n=1 Tax=Roseospirillum parvum TaxID=83401 RepID=A0A1G7XMN2_9PROT|nr:AarF/ABC1/UbiB kinase family protein [Roseospirillum parvum]SDG85336.1 Predicted unusual protein kinase regulating ubiquinone biosynthesis, AarF/ABC1/UbiB family [Roseospirillum parvum]